MVRTDLFAELAWSMVMLSLKDTGVISSPSESQGSCGTHDISDIDQTI